MRSLLRQLGVVAVILAGMFSAGSATPLNRVLRSFFAGSDEGALYDISRIDTLFQDVAMTLPVTAHGDPVGAVLDLSGRGHHWLQSTTTARPLYQVSGGLAYLLGDGVDDILAAASGYTLTLPHFVACAVSARGAGAVFNVGIAAGNRHGIDFATSPSNAIGRLRVSNTNYYSPSGATVTPGTVAVLDSVAAAASTDIAVNGSLTSGSTSATGSETVSNARPGLHAGNPVNVSMIDKFYGGMSYRGAVTTQQRQLVRRWLAQISGVAL